MRCVECGREQESADRGWVAVLSVREPRLVYCPDCVIALLRGAAGEDERERDSVNDVRP